MFRTLDEVVQAARGRRWVRVAIAAAQDIDCIEAKKQAREIEQAGGIFVGIGDKITAMTRGAG